MNVCRIAKYSEYIEGEIDGGFNVSDVDTLGQKLLFMGDQRKLPKKYLVESMTEFTDTLNKVMEKKD